LIYRHGLAIAIRVLLFIALPICLSHNLQAQTAKTEQVRTHPPGLARRMARQQILIIRHNEAGALRSLQTLFSSEATYQSTTGNGDYGTLEELRKQGLIDQVLVEGHRYGYRFRIRREKRSSESQPSLEITAVPRTYGRTGLRSFYMNESGVIYAADKKGAEATSADKSIVIDP
jgi:hypothetical protein